MRKYIAVLLLFSIVLSSCGKKDKNKSNDFVRTTVESPISNVPLVKYGSNTYSEHCSSNQRNLLDSLLKDSTVKIDSGKFNKDMVCVISVLIGSVDSSFCTAQQKDCFALNSHKALLDKPRLPFSPEQMDSVKSLLSHYEFTNSLSLEKFFSDKSYPDDSFLDMFFEENGFESYRPTSEVNDLNCFLALLENSDAKPSVYFEANEVNDTDSFLDLAENLDAKLVFFKSLLENPKYVTLVKIQQNRIAARDDWNDSLLTWIIYTCVGFITLAIHAVNKFCIVDPDLRFDGFQIAGFGALGLFFAWVGKKTIGRLAKWH